MSDFAIKNLEEVRQVLLDQAHTIDKLTEDKAVLELLLAEQVEKTSKCADAFNAYMLRKGDNPATFEPEEQE